MFIIWFSFLFCSLIKPEILAELLSLITKEPPKDEDAVDDEATRFKLPYVASEILSCEDLQISTAITSEESLLETLFSFLEHDAPLNPLLASFFSKAVGTLLSRKPDQVRIFPARNIVLTTINPW